MNSSIDMWGLGCLIWEAFNGPLQQKANLKSLEQIPQQLTTVYRELTGTSPEGRPNPADVIARCRSNGGFFKNDLVDALLFLEEIQMKEKSEKTRFFSQLAGQMECFPEGVGRYKILPLLIAAFEFGEAGSAVLPPLLQLGNQLPDAEYQKRVVPCVVKLFASNDRATRLRLLQQLDRFVNHLQPATVNDAIFPQVARGFLDTNPAVREQTIKSVVHLAPKLDYNNLNVEVLRYFAKLQSTDEQGGIRTNTTVCLGKIAQHLHPQIRQKVLIGAFIRGTRDPFPPARSASLSALAITQQYYLLQEVANRILPALCPLTTDADKSVRDNAGISSMMNHNRRKKKRINYGVRAVELMRGAKGFGFTISGQQPCILSCIVPGSPAELVGLRPGDYLVAVNGHNVSKSPHDDVVQLIGNSTGILRLQIAENYYSDSSDEEGPAAARSKPKYSHKQKNTVVASHQCATSGGPLHQQSRVAKVVRDLHSGAMFTGNILEQEEEQSCHTNQTGLYHHRCWNMPNAPPPPHKLDSEKIVHRTVVGYLGTIDIPNQLHPSTMMQVLRKCIKRLKTEKRNPTTVLLTIHVANIKLANAEKKIIAEYPSYRIVFCNSFSDQDKQYFGIVTKSAKDANEDIVSNSCHVFTIYYKLIDHSVHLNTSNIFGFTCTKTSELSVCQEFPDSCHGLIGAIQTLYISSDSKDSPGENNNNSRNNKNDNNNPFVDGASSASRTREGRRDVVSPQPSNISTSTAHSSNSDSGIGFKDDYSIQAERNINFDIISSRLTVRAIPSETVSLENSGQILDHRDVEGKKRDDGGNRGDITCLSAATVAAAGPSGVGSMAKLLRTSSSSVGSSTVSRTIATMLPNAAIQHDNIDCCDTQILSEKFSLKVFNVPRALVHSMESMPVEKTIPDTDTDANFVKPADVRPWGSLQEIRNIGGYQSNNSLYGSTDSCDKNDDGGVHTWVVGFEKLLKDPKGLQTFAEFLKKEFSHENIYFWAACERYKDTEDIPSRIRLAWQIYHRHLSTNAPEPVNVDSHAAGQITQELLNQAPEHLFLQAQKQVFELMKFDSYPRFLRSELYRQCLESGSSIIKYEDHDLDLTTSTNIKLKKSHSDVEDRCRKSILPWNRKNRSKSKDRGESEYNKTPSRGEPMYKSFTTIKRDPESNNNDDNVSISSSRSSLASWDLALRQSFSKHSLSSYDGQNEKRDVSQTKCTGLCRVILPDGSTTVVPTSQSESIKDVVTRLLDKRALRYSNYDVLVLATDEMVNLKYSSSVLAGQEVEVVPNKVLKIDLPSRRIITVVAHKGRTLREVLKPLLNKYGFKLELITIWGEGHPVSLDIAAINSPSRLVLTSNNEEFHRDNLNYQEDIEQGQSTLDEITNKVFEELLVGKTASHNSGRHYNTEGSCKSDDQRSEGSSILSSKFLFTRDTNILGKKKTKSKSSNLSDKSQSTTTATTTTAIATTTTTTTTATSTTTTTGGEESFPSNSRPLPSQSSHAPLIAKWRNGVKLQLPGRFDGDELYEGLKRAQRSRLEDQRGTEINFELPDFLKQDKENGKKQTDSKKQRRGRGFLGSNSDCTSKFYDASDYKSKKMAKSINLSHKKHSVGKCNFNCQELAEEEERRDEEVDSEEGYSSRNLNSKKRFDSMNSLDGTLEDVDKTIIENGDCTQSSNNQDTSSDSNHLSTGSPARLLKPPPLPPKPKGLLLTNAAAIKNNQILQTKPSSRSAQISPILPLESLEDKNIF